MIPFIVSILTDPAVLAVLGTVGVAILDALSAAMLGTHPLIARALRALADLIRAKAGRPPLPPLLLALGLLPLFAADSQAGPLRDWIRARRSGGCPGCYQPAPGCYAAPCQACAPAARASTCPCPGNCECTGEARRYYTCPAQHGGICVVAPIPQQMPAARPLTAFPVYQPPSCPSCPGGVCPAPSRPGLFRR